MKTEVKEHISIRRAISQDADGIVDIVRGQFDPEWLACIIYSCDGVNKYLQTKLAVASPISDSLYAVLSLKEQIIGYIELRRLPRSVLLSYIAIVADYQAHGLGQQLLRTTLENEYRPEWETMYLDVFENNTTALNWYRKLGFQQVYITEWWDIPIISTSLLANAYLSGYTEATLCQQEFGFSQFKVMTTSGEYTIGRMGHKWFRVTQPESLYDPEMLKVLSEIDPQRRILALLKDPSSPVNIPDARLITRTYRMSMPLDALMLKLRSK